MTKTPAPTGPAEFHPDHVGSLFSDWLDEEGIGAEVRKAAAAAVGKRVRIELEDAP